MVAGFTPARLANAATSRYSVGMVVRPFLVASACRVSRAGADRPTPNMYERNPATMNTTTGLQTHYNALRSWAEGMNTTAAATELLIRGDWAQPSRPWIHTEPNGTVWCDFAAIPHQIGAYSGGEQRFLRIAASIANSDVTISIGDNISGLGHAHVALVLAAIAHAAGYNEPIRVPDFDHTDDKRRRQLQRQPPDAMDRKARLYPWPALRTD